MAYLRLSGLGETRERTLADLERMCANGDQYACTLMRSKRTTGQTSTTTNEQAAVERNRQAVAERDFLARKAEAAGINPKIVNAIRQAQDVEYKERASFPVWLLAAIPVIFLAVKK